MTKAKKYTGLDVGEASSYTVVGLLTTSPFALAGIAVALVAIPTITVLAVMAASGAFEGGSGNTQTATAVCDWKGATTPLGTNSTSPPPASVLLAGQSNAVGIFYNCPNYTKIGTSYLHMDFEWNTLGVGASGSPFGPELGASEVLNGSIAKVAIGGAAIGDFLPGGSMFPEITAAPLAQHCALFWVQGETDAASLALATQYAQNFQLLRAGIQNQSNCSNLVIVSALLRPSDFGLMPYLETVNQALRAHSDAVVETQNLTLSDTIHYDGLSTLQLGRDLANAYLNLM